jgi:threonine/homoserine/homoserine lactone efflux protein
MDIFFRGLIIGFSIAAPVGPIGVLCIQQTLTNSRVAGLVSGLGAASADGIYGIIVGFGITFISSFLFSQHSWFRLFGGLYLCFLGFQAFTSKPEILVPQGHNKGFVGIYISTFLLTLTNPMTILSFTAIFAGFGLPQSHSNVTAAASLVLGVTTGSAIWWLTLSQMVGILRERFKPQRIAWVNKISGVTLISFGILVLMSLLLQKSPL